MFFQASSSNVQRGPNHYSRSWPHLVLSSWWECLSKTRTRYRQGLGPSQLPLHHIRSLYTPIRRIHSPSLRPRRERPSCRAAKKADELTSSQGWHGLPTPEQCCPIMRKVRHEERDCYG